MKTFRNSFLYGLFFATLCSTAVHAAQQQFINAGEHEDLRLAVSTGDKNFRVGNALLLRVISMQKNGEYGSAFQVLTSCDGSWATSSIQLYMSHSPKSFEDIYISAVKNDEPQPLGGIYFYNPKNGYIST